MNEFYENIEEPIRDIVRVLRDNGVNTTCSCGHEMYVEADLIPDGMLQIIHRTLFNYLAEKKLPLNYSIVINHVVKNGQVFQCFAYISLVEE